MAKAKVVKAKAEKVKPAGPSITNMMPKGVNSLVILLANPFASIRVVVDVGSLKRSVEARERLLEAWRGRKQEAATEELDPPVQGGVESADDLT
jgi:hypothetical protein